LRLKIIKSIF